MEASLLVIEGIDGSGKATQTKLLAKKLNEEGCEVETIDFPQWGTKSVCLLENYLNGKYGSSKELGAYIPSIFYACDRFDASFKIRRWLEEGKVVIADRYVASSIGHQGGKIEDKKRPWGMGNGFKGHLYLLFLESRGSFRLSSKRGGRQNSI